MNDNPHARHTPADGINIELLQQTLAQIEAHPEEWEQDSWRCQTGKCFAGWAATLAGGEWAHDGVTPSSYLQSDDCDLDDGEVSNVIHVEYRASRVLGFEEGSWTAEALFNGDNDLGALRRIVGDLIDKERERRASLVVNNPEGLSWPDPVDVEAVTH